MSYLDPLDDLPPPPAYSPEEFDRKISTTVQLSLNTPQPQHPGDDEWEEWDDAAFEAAARALAVGGPSSSAQAGSSVQPVEPLKIKKKGTEPNTSSKPRPSWLPQAESVPQPQDAGSSRQVLCNNTTSMPVAAVREPSDDGEDQPPPAFTTDAPPLDGPPYEQVVSPPWVADGSSLASPLNSPTLPPQQLVGFDPQRGIHPPISPPPPPPDTRHRSPQPQANMQHWAPQPQGDMHLVIPQGGLPHHPSRNSLPSTPQRTHHSVPQRPVSGYPIHKPSILPSPNFDLSMAYKQESNQVPMGRDYAPQPPATDYAYAAPFYNAAVASQLRARPAQSNHSHHMPNQPNYYPPTNYPVQRPHDSGSYGRGPLTPVRNPAASRYSQYSQYPGSAMTPHLPR